MLDLTYHVPVILLFSALVPSAAVAGGHENFGVAVQMSAQEVRGIRALD
ncbi:MAG: hypothetical protein ABSD56_04320 [Bryobacteraceae bacterium]